MMSTKPEQIDLNADIVSVDRENDVHTPLIGDSVAEALTDCSIGQVQDSLVDKVGVCDSAEVICDLNIGADDVNTSSGGIEREVDVLDAAINVERGNECIDRGFGVEAEVNIVRCDHDVSTRDENEVEAVQVAERAPGEGRMDHDMKGGPVEKVLELDQGTCVSGRSSSSDKDTIQSPAHKSEEGTSDGLENQAMDIDSPPEYNEDELVDVHIMEVETSSDVLNEPYGVNLEVDLNQFCTTDGNVADGSTKLVASNTEFCVSDLVWGKVRSHPWWPGQIFAPSAASQKAKKYFKKDSYLIAYFGDQTFAWNDPSKIKPFREHFTQMENQTNLEDFHYAVDCALEEVSRRVEFGLACSCIPEEALASIKTQMIVNAGIRKESSTRDGGDNYSNAASFDPVKLFKHVKASAQLLYYSGDDRLGFVTVKAQLSAFYRWKGYLQLPEFNVLGGLLDSDAEIPLSEEEDSAEMTQNDASDFKDDKRVSSGAGKSYSQEDSHKRKQTSGDSTHPCKKEKSLVDLLAEKHTNTSNSKSGSDGKGHKLISSSSSRKRKAVDSMSDISVKHKKLDSISDDVTVKHKRGDILPVKCERRDLLIGDADKCLPIKRTFGVGNSILKVASQLNGLSPLLKCADGTSRKTVVKKSKEKSDFRNSQSKKHFLSEESSTDDFLSQLRLAARDPMTGCSFLTSLVSFFSEFRNSVRLEQSQGELSGDSTRKTLTKSETTETPESELIKDSYWTDRVIESIPEEQQPLENKNEAGEVLHKNPSQNDISHVEAQSNVQLIASLEPGRQTDGENLELKAVKAVDPLDGRCNEDLCPTALILNFTDPESVPSKENLNYIFSRFGPLNELETEVLKSKRAKVVFKRRADAETAFSSAGKYSIFGPALVSYCLKYMSSTPSKASSRTTKRTRKVSNYEEGNST